MQFSGWNTVSLFPSLIVPPNGPWLCSGISITTGEVVSGSISVELASFFNKTFLANSITAVWNPKQIPGKKKKKLNKKPKKYFLKKKN